MLTASLPPLARSRAEAVKARIVAGNIGYQARMISAETHEQRLAIATAADKDHRDLWAIAHAHEAKLHQIDGIVLGALAARTPESAMRALHSIEAILRAVRP